MKTRLDNWVVFCLALLILGSFALNGQSQRSPSTQPLSNPRYELVSAIVNESTANGGHADFHDIFLLDRVSGQTWIYADGLEYTDADGKKSHLDSYFSERDVDGLTGDVMKKQINQLGFLDHPAKPTPQ